MRYVFGDCELDEDSYEFRRAGVLIPLGSKVFDVLVYLIRHRHRIVRRRELFEHIWPHLVVSETTLGRCIAEIRKAIGRGAYSGEMIKTIYGQGYHFVAAIEEIPMESPEIAPPSPILLPIPRPPDETPRQVTVLCGECVDSGQGLASLLPEIFDRLLYHSFAVITQTVQHYEGSIRHFTATGFVALFGVPHTLEDHPQRALLAAAALQYRLQEVIKAMAPDLQSAVTWPMGLHSGEVIGRRLGDDRRLTYMEVRSTFRLAAQMQRLGSPSSIIVSQATADLLHGLAQLESLTFPSAQEKTTEPAAYRFRRLHPLSLRTSSSLSPFVGRVHELAALQEALKRVKQGQGQVIGLVGEAGIGKTRLLYEFSRRLPVPRVSYFAGQCLAYESATPYGPLARAFKQYCSMIEGEPGESRMVKLRQALQETPLDDEAVLPYLLSLLGGEEQPDFFTRLTAPAWRARTLNALLQFCLARSQTEPLILEIDDIQWIDATSEEFLTMLIERLGRAPILVLLTYRPGYRLPWVEKSYVTQLSLAPLSAEESLALLEAQRHHTPGNQAYLPQILARGNGNPLFLEELLRTARDTAKSPLLLPDTVEGLLGLRTSHLPMAARHLLQIAAVLGMRIPVALLTAIVEHSAEDIRPDLHTLKANGFLQETFEPLHPTYTFQHVLMQEAVYHGLLPRTRQTLHQRIVQVLQARFPDLIATRPELLARHATAAGLLAQAVPYWQRAGQHALEQAAAQEALQHFTQGFHLLSTMPDTPERARHELALQSGRGFALIQTHGYAAPEVQEALARATDLCAQLDEAEQLFPVRAGIWNFHLIRAELAQAQEHAVQLWRLAEARRHTALTLEASMTLGSTLFHAGEFIPAQTSLEHCLNLYDPARHPEHSAIYGDNPGLIAFSVLCMLKWVTGYPQQARTLWQAVVARVGALIHPCSNLPALGYAGLATTLWQDLQSCLSTAGTCITQAREQGFPDWGNAALWWYGWAHARLVNMAAGMWQMRQGATASRARGVRLGYAHYLALLADLYSNNGQPEMGLRELAPAFPWIETTGERWNEAELYRLQGVLLGQQGQQQSGRQQQATWQRAENSLQQAIVIARKQQAKSWELRAAISLAHLWRAQGNTSAAYNMLAPVYAWFSEGHDSVDLQNARQLLAVLA